MSNFEVKIVTINGIEQIPNADSIELARIGDYRSVIAKGQFKVGAWVAYIPESSIVPEWILKKMGLKDKLAGSNKNRVKAIRLRGAVSQGLLYPIIDSCDKEFDRVGNDLVVTIGDKKYYIETENSLELVQLGQDVSKILGIKKYEPVIPAAMSGEVCNIGTENILKYDIENLKKHPHIFEEGEEVSVTEKLHGTFMQIGFVPDLNHPEIFENGNVFVCSKGLGAQGLVFKNNEKNESNLYVRTFTELTKDKKWKDILVQTFDMKEPIYIMGEVFGRGVQDLTYGLDKPEFRVFDIYIGKPGQGQYLVPDEMQLVSKSLGLKTVTELYRGPYDRAKIDSLANGKTVTGSGSNVLEGVVVKPMVERRNDEIGRVFLKHINEEYLLRKNKDATEFN